MAGVLITGGGGFLGRKLVDALLERGTIGDASGIQQPLNLVRVADLHTPARALPDNDVIEQVYGDFTAPGAADALVTQEISHIVHLAAAVSGECEQDFDLGMRVNLDGTRGLLEAAASLRYVTTFCIYKLGGRLWGRHARDPRRRDTG